MAIHISLLTITDLWSNMWTSFSAWVHLGFINSTNWFVIKYVPTHMPAFIKISLTQTRVHLNFISKNKLFVIKHVYVVIHKVRTVIFRNFRPPFPHVRAHTLLSYKPSPQVQAHGYCFLKKMRQKYILDIQLKNHVPRKIKKILYKTIGKYRIKTPRTLASSLRSLTVRGR